VGKEWPKLHSFAKRRNCAGEWAPQLEELAQKLEKVQSFYDCLGGIVGYQLKCLELIDAALEEEESDGPCTSNVEFLVPQGTNLQGPEARPAALKAAADGLQAMPMLAEIYPLGGALWLRAC
jgi:hypothetical protein